MVRGSLNAERNVMTEPRTDKDALCRQIGLCARFDRNELGVETFPYFHDDESIVDAFDDEGVQAVSTRFLAVCGFFLVPAHRTWDRLVSFNSKLTDPGEIIREVDEPESQKY